MTRSRIYSQAERQRINAVVRRVEGQPRDLLGETTPTLTSVHKGPIVQITAATPRAGLDNQWTYTADKARPSNADGDLAAIVGAGAREYTFTNIAEKANTATHVNRGVPLSIGGATFTAGPLEVGSFVQLEGPYKHESQSIWYCDAEIPLIEMECGESPTPSPTPTPTATPSATPSPTPTPTSTPSPSDPVTQPDSGTPTPTPTPSPTPSPSPTGSFTSPTPSGGITSEPSPSDTIGP